MTPIKIRHLSFRSLVYYTAITVGIIAFMAYVFWQARFLINGPQVTFQNNPPVSETSRTVTLQGIAHNIVQLTLDGRPIYTDKNGYFKETLVLENGYTIATIDAEDRYGRVRTYQKHFVYTPALSLSK